MFVLKSLNPSEKLIGKLKYALTAFFIIPFVPLVVFQMSELWLSLTISVAACGILGFLFIKFKLYGYMVRNSVLGYVCAVGCTILFCLRFWEDKNILLSIFSALVFFNAANMILSLFFKFCCNGRLNPKNLVSVSFGAISLAFTLFFFLPGDSYINNINDFDFAYQDFAVYMFEPALILIFVTGAIGLLLNERFLKLYLSFLAGINICVYFQYMFLNSNLPVLIGDGVDWDKFTGYSVITAVLWVFFLALPFVAQFLIEKIWVKAVKKVPLFIGLIEAVSLGILIVTASGDIFSRNDLILSGEEQYTVSKNKNIITIILDATDNKYIMDTLSSRPEAFSGYEDFTVYTNTCSVFDSTFQSLTQVYSGIESKPVIKVSDWNDQAWNSEKAGEFYKRFHNAAYKMNFFADANWDLSLLRDKIDNITSSKISKSSDSHKNLVSDFNRLTAYRVMPFALKRFFSVDGLDLNRNFQTADNFKFYNEEFREPLDTMKLSDSDKNYFIVEHIWGAHTPLDKATFVDTTEYILEIVREYLNNLKKFGVYDDSTIIIMADHGSHDLPNFPDSTPMFMIKEANKKSDRITLSTAPIYFSDLMSTYLVNAGLYDDEAKELFGPSIYDFKDGDLRERVANYRINDKNYPPSKISPLVPSFGYNVIYSYRYTGDTSDLLGVIKTIGPESITHMEEDAS